MLNIKILYASITGNNEEIADVVMEAFEEELPDATIDLTEISQADPTDLENCDIAVIVSYTYDDEIVPDEALDYYEDLQNLSLPNLTYGVAGSGDTFYDDFCTTVDNFEAAFAQTGATLGAKTVKINLDADATDIKRLDKMVSDIILKATDKEI